MSFLDQVQGQERPLNSMETFDAAIELIRSDRLRTFRVDIDTDSMAAEDDEAEKQSRVEFIAAATGFLQQMIPAAQTMPAMIPFLTELLMFGARGYKAGRPMEAAFEHMIEQLQNQPPQPEGEGEEGNPEAEAATAEAALIKARADEARAQTEQVKAQIELMKAEIQKEQLAHRQNIETVREQNAEAERARQHALELRRIEREDAVARAEIDEGQQEIEIKRDKLALEEAKAAEQADLNREKLSLDEDKTGAQLDLERDALGLEADKARSQESLEHDKLAEQSDARRESNEVARETAKQQAAKQQKSKDE